MATREVTLVVEVVDNDEVRLSDEAVQSIMHDALERAMTHPAMINGRFTMGKAKVLAALLASAIMADTEPTGPSVNGTDDDDSWGEYCG